MKATTLGFLMALTLLAWCGLPPGAYGGEDAAHKSQLTVPWDEFKRLLHLEDDRVVLSMETFEKLLAQTGATSTPPHAVKEGNVVLTRAEFKRLVDRMSPPAGLDTKPPCDYLITKAIYSGTMNEQNTAFSATFHVHVLKKHDYVKVPILPQATALKDVTVDAEPALVISENGQHTVVLSSAGEHVVVALFPLKTSLDKGPHKVDLAILQTPITLLRLELPLEGIDVEIPQAQQLLTSQRGDRTHISATIAPGRTISVRWRKQVPVAERIPPKLYAEVYHLTSIEDDALKVESDIIYNILHSELDNVRVSIPQDMNVLSVHGEGVGEWQETVQDNANMILIPFTYGKKGAVTVHIAAEKSLANEGKVTAFSGFRVLDTVRESGFIGVELKTSAEVTVTESEGLEAVAVQKLPQVLHNRSVKPLMHGFKYHKHPYSLVLAIDKHEKIAVPVATISSANAVTLFTEDGKVVYRLVYQVRNSAKQFLEIQLPEKADVWSVFVGHQPAESAINAEGQLLVPLIRSRPVDNRLNAFPVEVVYCLVEEAFSLLRSRTAQLPAVDLLTSQLMWSVYLPNDYSYIHFASTLEKEEMIRGLNVFAGAQREYDESVMKEISEQEDQESIATYSDRVRKAYKGMDYQSKFRNVPLGEEQMSDQVAAEVEFGRRLEGLAQAGGAVGCDVRSGTGNRCIAHTDTGTHGRAGLQVCQNDHQDRGSAHGGRRLHAQLG
jgi:hypothetical protein